MHIGASPLGVFTQPSKGAIVPKPGGDVDGLDIPYLSPPGFFLRNRARQCIACPGYLLLPAWGGVNCHKGVFLVRKESSGLPPAAERRDAMAQGAGDPGGGGGVPQDMEAVGIEPT